MSLVQHSEDLGKDRFSEFNNTGIINYIVAYRSEYFEDIGIDRSLTQECMLIIPYEKLYLFEKPLIRTKLNKYDTNALSIYELINNIITNHQLNPKYVKVEEVVYGYNNKHSKWCVEIFEESKVYDMLQSIQCKILLKDEVAENTIRYYDTITWEEFLVFIGMYLK